MNLIFLANNSGTGVGGEKKKFFQPVEALSLLSKCVVLESDEPSYYWHKAEAYLEACNFAMSISFFKVSISKIKQRQAAAASSSQQQQQQIIDIDSAIIPNQDEYFLHQAGGETDGEGLSFNNDSQEGEEEEMEEGSSRNRLYLEIRLAIVMYMYAQCLIDVKRYQEALVLLQEAYELGWEPDSIVMRMYRVKRRRLKWVILLTKLPSPRTLAFIGLKDFNSALEIIYNLVEKYPQNVNLYFLRARICRHLDKASIKILGKY